MSSEAQEAAKAVDAFHAKLAEGDGAAAAALLADDALIFESGHAERSRAEYASHHTGADAAYAAAVPSGPTRRDGFVDGDTAWIVSESRATGKHNDKPADCVATETMSLRKTAEGLRIAHIPLVVARREVIACQDSSTKRPSALRASASSLRAR